MPQMGLLPLLPPASYVLLINSPLSLCASIPLLPSEPRTCIAVPRLPGGVGSLCGYRRPGIAVLLPRTLVWLMGQWRHGYTGQPTCPVAGAPRPLNTLADALVYMIRERGVNWLEHYLDDYILVGPPGMEKCKRDLTVVLETCDEVGFPVQIEVDSKEMILRLSSKN